MSNQRNLKAFVRYDGSGRVVAGSLVLRKNKPKVGKWKEILTYECCNDIPTTSTTTTAALGTLVKISSDNMFDPICSAETTISVQVTSGTSLSDALTITGDFASLGAYYTPADPGNVMSQSPVFTIAYLVGGILKYRNFKLTAIGVASGEDIMFGLSQEFTCN
jgi:hypothetical protein